MRRVSSLLLALSTFVAALSAHADEPPPNPIATAEEAWAVGEVAKAGKLYEQALGQGGLSPSDTLDAFVRVGAWRASTGNNQAALNAFRNAALIDPSFEYPDKAGPKGKPLYERARKEAEGQGKLIIEVQAPAKVKAGEGFHVDATVPEALVPLFESVAIHVEDRPGNVTHAAEKPAEAKLGFDVPAGAATAGRNLDVRISVLDAQKNEWARGSVKIAVGTPVAAALAPVPIVAPVTAPPEQKRGFLATKWPFLLGGAAVLVAGVIVVGVVASSRSNVVTVNAPTWQTTAISR